MSKWIWTSCSRILRGNDRNRLSWLIKGRRERMEKSSALCTCQADDCAGRLIIRLLKAMLKVFTHFEGEWNRSLIETTCSWGANLSLGQEVPVCKFYCTRPRRAYEADGIVRAWIRFLRPRFQKKKRPVVLEKAPPLFITVFYAANSLPFSNRYGTAVVLIY